MISSMHVVCAVDSSLQSTQTVRGFREQSRVALVMGPVFSPFMCQEQVTLSCRLAPGCGESHSVWSEPLSQWLQITLIWNMKQKLKDTKAPVTRCHLGYLKWLNVSSFLRVHTHSFWISLYIYKFLILYPHTGDKKSGSISPLRCVVWVKCHQGRPLEKWNAMHMGGILTTTAFDNLLSDCFASCPECSENKGRPGRSSKALNDGSVDRTKAEGLCRMQACFPGRLTEQFFKCLQVQGRIPSSL